jgi:hypothetical protein
MVTPPAPVRRHAPAPACVLQAFDEPLGVVPSDELPDEPPRLREARELVQVDALFLERAHEAFGDAIALWFADVRRRDRAPEPLHLVDPGVGDVLRAPVTAQRQAARQSLPNRPKAGRTPWRIGSRSNAGGRPSWCQKPSPPKAPQDGFGLIHRPIAGSTTAATTPASALHVEKGHRPRSAASMPRAPRSARSLRRPDASICRMRSRL